MPTSVEVASVGPVFADTSYLERTPDWIHHRYWQNSLQVSPTINQFEHPGACLASAQHDRLSRVDGNTKCNIFDLFASCRCQSLWNTRDPSIYIYIYNMYIHKCGSRRYGCNWKTGVLRKAEVWVSCSNFVGRTWAIRNRVVLPNAARGSWFVTGLFG